MGVVLNKHTIEQIARLHDEDYDRRAKVFLDGYLDRSHLTKEELDAAGYIYPKRSHLTVCELQAVIDWKWPAGKTKKHAAKNGVEKVASVTGKAFAARDPIEAVRTLRGLHGVGVPMASAILTSFDPLRFTVLDVRAWNALKLLRLLDQLELAEFDGRLDEPETYAAYLQGCVRLADDAGVSLRSLDRCLWTLDASRSVMNQTGLYGWARDGVTLAPILTQSVRTANGYGRSEGS
ncbi:MAG: hypothetical protein M3O34_04140 [Chloroflexota bacterium]|nr:hypothetical protein [Chloroflexota bacterium]